MNNALHTIHPYKHEGQWVFDDDRFGLSREPFVFGADHVAEHLAHELGGVERFTLIVSASPLPSGRVFERESKLTPTRAGGCSYYWKEKKLHFWLCPALWHYFPNPPEHLYVAAKHWAGESSAHPCSDRPAAAA